MDEQRMQTYVKLIEQLLGCAQGEEATLLRMNEALVDARLMTEMSRYAIWLQSQGKSNAAEWLQRFAAQLTVARGMKTDELKGIEDAAQFLLDTLRFIDGKQSDQQQIYIVWAQQQPQMLALVDVFPQAVAQLYEQTGQPMVIARLLSTFSLLIWHFPLGIRWLNLELGIAACEQMLQIYTCDDFPAVWAGIQSNLSSLYVHRIREKRTENIERAIVAAQQALQVYTWNTFPEEWAIAQTHLAISYFERIQGDRSDNLETAIKLVQLALQIFTRQNHPKGWATAKSTLANAYAYQVRGSRSDNLEQAIIAYEQAIDVLANEPNLQQWAETLLNLGAAYYDRIQGNKADNLERAISIYEQALQVLTREEIPEQWARTQLNLANAYIVRIRGDRADNIERAIAIFEQILQIFTRTAFPQGWAMVYLNLAPAYLERLRGDKADNLEQAITASQKALHVLTVEVSPQDWSRASMNLANAYSDRIRGGRLENINQSVLIFKQIQQFFSHDKFPEEWAKIQINLANTYLKKLQEEDSGNFEQSIAAYRELLKVYTLQAFPEQWSMVHYNLALAYSKCNPVKALEAVAACQNALGVFTASTFPKQCKKTAKLLGDLYSQQQAWTQAIDAYCNAIEASEILYQSCILLEGKGTELKENFNLSRCAAYAFAQNEHLQDAIKLLEQSRARGLSESLDRDRANLAQLEQVAPLFYQQYQNITQQIRDLENQQRDQIVSSERHYGILESHRNLASSLHQNLDQIINEIRQIEGYKDFLTQLNLTDIWNGIQSSNPLIYLVSTPVGSLALIVTSSEIIKIWLDQINEFSLIKQLLGDIWFDAYIHRQTNPQDWLDAIDTTTRQLWDALMGPLVKQVKELGFDRITLIPTGFLSLLPLHAAWTEDESKPTKRRYAFDEIHITYAPNAKSLTASRAIADRVQTNSILAIDNPSEDLDNSEREVQAAIVSFLPQATILRHNLATTTAIKTALPQAVIAHFSCHGTANLNEPLNSGLVMSDGLLTLKDIFALNLAKSGGLRLAILSACETGIQGLDNADEAISLPTGLLQAGVAAVISSLWSVDDRSTRILLTRFYDLWRKDNLEPAEALRHAQFWMRDTSSQQKAKYFQKTHPDLFQALILLPPNHFAHPFHWAAFSYTGV